MEKKIKVGVVGATGYAGIELVRILCSHPYASLKRVSSVSFAGKCISEIYPGLKAGCNLILDKDPNEMLDKCDVVFGSLPHGLSEEIAEKSIQKGIVFIDLGADFRLEDGDEYAKWYGCEFRNPEFHKQAVYGLPELFREDILNTKLVANPGCYPTSVALGTYPALKNGLIDTKGIIIDSKSGVTGAGRKLSQNTHYPDCNEAFSAYKAGAHRHTPEMEQTLTKAAGVPVKVTFTPHLLPANRGILSTIYCDKKADYETIRKCYEEAYAKEPFVVLLEEGQYANIKNVRMSNCCHISLHQDKHTEKLIICSAIDNMVKGAAGQAIQNMNLIFGFEETCGLSVIAPPF